MLRPHLLLPLALLVVLVLASPCAAHNWLLEPYAFNEKFKTRDCRGAQCTNACPDLQHPSQMRNSPDRPARVWRRGQSVRVAWARNNHHGGFFAVSLVPVASMNSRPEHARLALEYGCWESGEFDCRAARAPCGTDLKKRAFRRQITIPTVFPDGIYVLGYVWFGGLHYRRYKGQFPDFWSCAFVKIQGGARLGGWHRAKFVPGWGRHIRYGKCQSSASAVGECGKNGCPRKRSFYGVPKPFQNGKQPAGITAWTVQQAFSSTSGSSNELKGLCKSNVCCKKTCGRCGGSNCNGLPGGGNNCCIGSIQKSNRPCSRFEPPCKRA